MASAELDCPESCNLNVANISIYSVNFCDICCRLCGLWVTWLVIRLSAVILSLDTAR